MGSGYGLQLPHLVRNALAQIQNAFADVGWVVVGLISILAGGCQQVLMCLLERLDARLQLDVIVRQLRLLARIARLLLDPLLAPRGEGGHGRGDGLAKVGEGRRELVHAD